jgi:tetratricopeptide (TPR) repeat protein
MRSFIGTLTATLVTTLILAALPVMGQRSSAGDERQRASRLMRAETFIRAQNLAGAESEIAAILEGNSGDGEALNLLGIVRARQLRADEAEALFKQSIAAAPRSAGARINLGLLYTAKGQLEAAAVQFEEALEIAPGNSETAAHLVTVLRGLAAAAIGSDPEKALSHLIRAKALVPSDPDVLFEFGMAALRLSLYEDARDSLNAALKKRPDDPLALYALARARMALGEVAEAEKLFRKYLALRPEDASGHYGLGYTLAIQRRNAEASRAFERSLELRPEQTESQYQLGLLASADGDFEQAAVRFEKVLARYADHAGALLGMGVVQFNRKEYEMARVNLERAVALDPSVTKAHYQLGLTYARLGDKARATQELELAAKLEREEKDKKRMVLRLLGTESYPSPSGDGKPAP